MQKYLIASFTIFIVISVGWYGILIMNTQLLNHDDQIKCINPNTSQIRKPSSKTKLHGSMQVSSAVRRILQTSKNLTTVEKVIDVLSRHSIKAYLQTDELNAILAAKAYDRHDQDPRDVKFTWIILASHDQKERMRVRLNTYANKLKNFFAFADKKDLSLRMITLPEIAGKPSYEDAQVRQLYGMRWLATSRSDLMNASDWFVLGDDDTWFNVPALSVFLAKYNPNLPLCFGYYKRAGMTGAFGNPLPESTFVGGGGGILSREAFKRLAPNIIKDCPFIETNDRTISTCLPQFGILKVHDARFHPEQYRPYRLQSSFNKLNDIASQFSYHYEFDESRLMAMTCVAADLYNRPDLTGKDCRPWIKLLGTHQAIRMNRKIDSPNTADKINLFT